MLNTFRNYLKNHYQWFFSGVGTQVITILISSSIFFPGAILLSDIASKKTKEEKIENINNSINNTSVINILGSVETSPAAIQKEEIQVPVSIKEKYLAEENNNAEKIKKAFKTLFGEWWIRPYHDNPDKHCTRYQGKWELDNETNPYHFLIGKVFNHHIYYVAHSVDAYAWCHLGKEGTDSLEIVELLMNRVYVRNDNRLDPTNNYESFKKSSTLIAKIGGLFIDQVNFVRSSKGVDCPKEGIPCERIGTRIGRYAIDLESKGNIESGTIQAIMDKVKEHIAGLSPECRVEMKGVEYEKTEQGFIPVLTAGKSVMEFHCYEDKSKEQSKFPPYVKSLKWIGG